MSIIASRGCCLTNNQGRKKHRFSRNWKKSGARENTEEQQVGAGRWKMSRGHVSWCKPREEDADVSDRIQHAFRMTTLAVAWRTEWRKPV